LIFTSPPYADIRTYGEGENEAGAQCHPDKYVEWFMPKAEVFKSVLKDSGSFILNIGDKIVDRCRHNYIFDLVLHLEKDLDFRRYETIFWDKGCSPPSSGRFRNTTEYLFWFVKKGFEDSFKFNIDRGRVPYNPTTLKRHKSLQSKWHTRDSAKEKCPDCGEQRKYEKDRLFCLACGNEESVKLKKVDANPLGAIPSTLLKMGSESRNTGYHTAVFPKKLPSYFIPIATDDGDIVYDPFMGNCTTALACIDLNRRYIGSELVKDIHDYGIGRIDKYKESLSNEAKQ
jgi:DNA modification methylase